MSTDTSTFRRHVPEGRRLRLIVLLGLLEVLLAIGYVGATQAGITRPVLVVLVPAIWINLSLAVFLRVRPAESDGGRWAAALIAGGYFVLLSVLGGLLVGGDGGTAAGLRVHLTGFPGWVPLVVFDLGPATLVIVPFKLVGYLALTYLVYVTAMDAAGALLGGVVGLLSCVSCTFPLIAGLVTGLAGGGAAAAAVYTNAYGLSTAVFVLTVLLLSWRPAAGGLDRARKWFSLE